MKYAVLLVALALLCPPDQAQGEQQAQSSSTNGTDLASIKQQMDALTKQQQQILDKLNDLERSLLGRTEPLPSTTDVSGERFRGASSARVVIIEYGDFECEFCGQFERETYPQILKNYIETARVKYIYRDLPLHHPHAMLAARASRCAGDQGKYWEMHDALFANQANLATEHITELAVSLGLDQGKFAACMASDRFTREIEASASQAQSLGMTGTPSFIIGTLQGDSSTTLRIDSRFVGAVPYERLSTDLDRLLAGGG